MTGTRAYSGQRDWRRLYPPLLGIPAAVLIAVFTLPSALNLPQANPGQVAEYAPVPGSSSSAPPGGNFAALGFGEGGEAEGGSGPLQAQAPGTSVPTIYDCVGTPPRQTEDPLSPPCVPAYVGSNGGSTYQGVSATEIRVLMYIPGGTCQGQPSGNADVGSQGTENRPSGGLYDLEEPAQPSDTYPVVAARLWQTYFNRRYQTYHRRVHFYLQFASDDCSSSATVADAANDEHEIHPFAVVFPDIKDGGYVSTFGKYMASYGVLSFGGSEPLAASFYSSYARLIWSYLPSADQYAQQFASWVCSKVVGRPVATTPVNAGAPRKLAIMYPSAEHTVIGVKPGTTATVGDDTWNAFGVDAQADIERCSGNSQIFGGDVATIDDTGAIEIGTQNRQDALLRMHNFQSDGVTTVVWAGGFETDDTAAASQLGYEPEWIVAGDGALDDLVGSRYQDQTEWSHAWTLTDEPLYPPWQQTFCVVAIKETDPGFPESDTSIPCRMYADYRLLFTAVQVAGPSLDPAHVDEGLHAIPGVQTSDPRTPACFFNPGDYTCIKDSIAMWWDETARSQFSLGPGCYRVPEAGRRFLPGGWQAGNVNAAETANDPCNGYVSTRFEDPTGQGPDAPPGQ